MTPLDLVARGFYIFPLAPNSKEPPKGMFWTAASTLDPSVVTDWIHRYPRCGWGIDCGKSGLLVVDDDRGKNAAAVASLAALEIEHGDIPSTFTVKTKSGGYHYYYRGVGRTSASAALGKGLDSRGVGGYVVAPGTPGYDVDVDVEIVDAPEWLTTLLGGAQAPAADRAVPLGDLDTPDNLARARAYLATAPDAPGPRHGGGGGYHTIKVACRIRDFGISEIACTDLIYGSEWARRVEPPWDDWDELAAKVGNAYRYAKGRIGNADPAVAFPPVTLPESETPSLPLAAWNILRTREIRVDYLVHERIETPSTGLIFGDPSAGKSFLAVDLACGVACGAGWQGALARAGVAVYFAGEGRHGIYRRIRAWEAHHGIRAPDNRLWISEHRIEFSGSGLAAAIAQMEAIEKAAGCPIAVCVVDTLARHIAIDADENSARDAGAFINAADHLRDRFRCVVAVVHHAGKMSKDSSRGSSAIRGAMDWECRVEARGESRKVVWTKQKETELPPPLGFAIEPVDIGGGVTSAVPVPCAIAEDVSDLTPGTAAALASLRILISENGGKPVSREAWREALKATLGPSTTRSTVTMRFQRAEKSLFTSNLIAIAGEGVSLVSD